MKQLLYLFGEPGTGKITVARILQARLGWRLFWLHDLDSVCAIVGRYPLPRLMDRISLAVLEELTDAGENIIYVRPSRDRESVVRVLELAERAGYDSLAVRLWAPREVMLERVTSRERSAYRIGSAVELVNYLEARPSTSSDLASVTVSTLGVDAEQVADRIEGYLRGRTDGDRNERTSDERVPAAVGRAPAE